MTTEKKIAQLEKKELKELIDKQLFFHEEEISAPALKLRKAFGEKLSFAENSWTTADATQAMTRLGVPPVAFKSVYDTALGIRDTGE